MTRIKTLVMCILCYVCPAAMVAQDEANSWNFSIFSADVKVKPRVRQSSSRSEIENSFCIGGLGFGFLNALNAPSQMDVDMSASKEIFFNLFYYGRKYNNRHRLGIGLGFNWKNYRMTVYNRFEKDGLNIIISPYPTGADINFSRLRVFSVAFPLEY